MEKYTLIKLKADQNDLYVPKYHFGTKINSNKQKIAVFKEYLVLSVSPDLVFRKNNGEKQILDDLYHAIHYIKKKLVKNGEVPKEALEKTKKPN